MLQGISKTVRAPWLLSNWPGYLKTLSSPQHIFLITSFEAGISDKDLRSKGPEFQSFVDDIIGVER